MESERRPGYLAGIDESIYVLDENLRGARMVLLTVNIICAFLFLTVFELVLGWQPFRPAASRYIFAEHLTKIAMTDTSSQNLSVYERGIISLARNRCLEILSLPRQYGGPSALHEQLVASPFDPKLPPDSFREVLLTCLKQPPTWVYEEQLRGFVHGVDLLQTGLEEVSMALKVDPAELPNMRKETDVNESSTKSGGTTPTLEPGTLPPQLRHEGLPAWAERMGLDTAIAVGLRASDTQAFSGFMRYATLRLDNEQLAYSLQEIRDRYEVNETTKGRRVGRREYAFPVIGTAMQVEDLTLPIALFLGLLSYWLLTSLTKAYDSARTFMLRGETVKLDPDGWRLHLLSLVDHFQFVRLRPCLERALGNANAEEHPPQYNPGLIWLFMAPYLVVAASIMANLHESLLLDVRWHSSTFLFRSETFRAFVVIYVLLLACMCGLGAIALKMRKHFVRFYLDTSRVVHAKMMCKPHDHEREKESCERHSLVVTAWVAIAPFVVFGSVSALSACEATYLKEYLFGWWSAAGLMLVILTYILGLVAAFRIEDGAQSFMLRLCTTAIFGALPLALFVEAINRIVSDVGTIGIRNRLEAIPIVVTIAGIVVWGMIGGTYRSLPSGFDASPRQRTSKGRT